MWWTTNFITPQPSQNPLYSPCLKEHNVGEVMFQTQYCQDYNEHRSYENNGIMMLGMVQKELQLIVQVILHVH